MYSEEDSPDYYLKIKKDKIASGKDKHYITLLSSHID